VFFQVHGICAHFMNLVCFFSFFFFGFVFLGLDSFVLVPKLEALFGS